MLNEKIGQTSLPPRANWAETATWPIERYPNRNDLTNATAAPIMPSSTVYLECSLPQRRGPNSFYKRICFSTRIQLTAFTTRCLSPTGRRAIALAYCSNGSGRWATKMSAATSTRRNRRCFAWASRSMFTAMKPARRRSSLSTSFQESFPSTNGNKSKKDCGSAFTL